MSDHGDSQSDCANFYPLSALIVLQHFHETLDNILDARKKLESLPKHEQTVKKIDDIVKKEVGEVDKILEKMDLDKIWREDDEDDYEDAFGNDFDKLGYISTMLRSAACIDGALSKHDTLKGSTGGIAKCIEKLVQKMEELVNHIPEKET